jgi:hypothetical protein
MNALAILTKNRSPKMPNPALFALFLPMPTAVIQKLHDATVAAINNPAVAAKRNELMPSRLTGHIPLALKPACSSAFAEAAS